MRLSVRAMALAGALVWGGAILLVGLINHELPNYGLGFLQMMSSVYPGFHAFHTMLGVLIGTLDGIVDGAIAGMLFAWLYNKFAGIPSQV